MNSPGRPGDCHAFHFPMRTLMARLGFLACLLPGIALGASSEPLDLDITVTDTHDAPVANLPLRIVLDSDEDARAPGAGQHLVTDAHGRIQRELRVKADRRSVSIYNFIGVPILWNRVDTIQVGFEPTSLGGQPILYWLWFDYYTRSASRVGFTYAQDESGHFVRELNFSWDSHFANSDYRYAPRYSKSEGPPLIRPPARLGCKDVQLLREEQPDGSRRWKLQARLEVVPWTGDE